eukprot:9501768-Pyramimonas_sp.AAC.1
MDEGCFKVEDYADNGVKAETVVDDGSVALTADQHKKKQAALTNAITEARRERGRAGAKAQGEEGGARTGRRGGFRRLRGFRLRGRRRGFRRRG